MASPIVPLLGLGAAALFLFSSKKSSASPATTSPRSPGLPQIPVTTVNPESPAAEQLAKTIANALNNGPAAAAALATTLEQNGFAAEAAELRAKAMQLALERAGTSKPPPAPAVPSRGDVATRTPGVFPPLPNNTSSQPAAPVPAVSPPLAPAPSGLGDPLLVRFPARQDSERLRIAQSLALHLRGKVKGREDMTLVKRFQLQEGLKADGMYGPSTATAVAAYGIVPPKPLYYSKNASTRKQAAADYVAIMSANARKDPERADEWITAATAVSNVA